VTEEMARPGSGPTGARHQCPAHPSGKQPSASGTEGSFPWSRVGRSGGKIIASVLAEIAGVATEEMTRITTLFHLGLDSISAIKILSALKNSISLYLDYVSAMSKNPTVGKYGQGSLVTQPVYQDNIE
jgi:acyl carrier protein